MPANRSRQIEESSRRSLLARLGALAGALAVGLPLLSGNAAAADLIVKAAVKEALDDEVPGMEAHPEFFAALEDDVAELVEDAARRAEADGRMTVQPRDL